MFALHCFRLRCFLLLVGFLAASTIQTSWAQEQPIADRFTIPTSDDGLPGAGPIRRYDWFQNLWQTKRSAWATRVAQDQQAVVFLGDSITQGWGDNFGGQFARMKCANRGISGDTTRGMLFRLEEDVLALNPSCVVMLMGTNDLEEAATPETIAGNFQLILAAIKAHNPRLPIVVCEVFPSSASKRRPADKIKQLNQLYWQAVKGDSQVTFLETWKLFADESGDAKASEFPDSLHPNEAGYDKWAGALRPIFATLGFRETSPDDFELETDFTSLFNGTDLTGWCYLPTPADQRQLRTRIHSRTPNEPAWPLVEELVDFAGQTQSHDGRYRAIHDRLVVTTPATGRAIQTLSTRQEFPGDFTLKLEFRATPNADSGIFLRGRQLQCRDYPLAGPYTELKNYRTGDWNELVVVVTNNVAHCTCNGEVLEAAFELPESGPIGLEGDRGQIEYRRIRILASS
ncbi:GDSL-type esterase/lipase family protein [Planctomycetaceae bacterium SH139]